VEGRDLPSWLRDDDDDNDDVVKNTQICTADFDPVTAEDFSVLRRVATDQRAHGPAVDIAR